MLTPSVGCACTALPLAGALLYVIGAELPKISHLTPIDFLVVATLLIQSLIVILGWVTGGSFETDDFTPRSIMFQDTETAEAIDLIACWALAAALVAAVVAFFVLPAYRHSRVGRWAWPPTLSKPADARVEEYRDGERLLGMGSLQPVHPKSKPGVLQQMTRYFFFCRVRCVHAALDLPGAGQSHLPRLHAHTRTRASHDITDLPVLLFRRSFSTSSPTQTRATSFSFVSLTHRPSALPNKVPTRSPLSMLARRTTSRKIRRAPSETWGSPQWHCEKHFPLASRAAQTQHAESKKFWLQFANCADTKFAHAQHLIRVGRGYSSALVWADSTRQSAYTR